MKRFFLDIVAPALFVAWIAYIAFGAMAGASGYRALKKLEMEAAAKAETVDGLVDQRIKLARRADMLNPRSLDPDIADESIRAVLGYVHPDDVVLPRHELTRLLEENQEK